MAQQLAYDSSYQAMILAECLYNVAHCELARDSIKAENFSDSCLQWFFDKITKADVHLTKSTLKEELLKANAKKLIKKEEVPRYLEVYKTVIQKPSSLDSDHIRETMVKFIRTQNVRKAILDSMDLVADQKWTEVEAVMSAALSSGVDILSNGQDYIEAIDERLQRREDEGNSKKISLGIPELDQALYGGIENKQVAMCVGGSGRGKSQMLAWAARHALMLGHSVVYFTFELPEDKIAERLDSMITRIKPQELKTSTAEAKKKLDTFGKRCAGGKLFIKEFGPDTTTVPALKTYLKQLEVQGVKADLVIVDYLDLIKPHRTYGDIHTEVDAVVKALCGLAKELDTRVLTASQLNRAGMVAENPDESSLAGTVNKLFNVDIAIFMAQNKEERELEEMRLLIIKNRNGAAGQCIKIETDFAYMSFYRAAMKQDESYEEG